MLWIKVLRVHSEKHRIRSQVESPETRSGGSADRDQHLNQFSFIITEMLRETSNEVLRVTALLQQLIFQVIIIKLCVSVSFRLQKLSGFVSGSFHELFFFTTCCHSYCAYVQH